MKAHITKHKKKYGFVAAVGVAGFSFNALIQQPATVPEPTKPTISQRQEVANQRLEADKQRCDEWIPQEKRVALFGAAFDTIGGQFFSATGTESLSCTFREASTSYLLTKRAFEDDARADQIFEASLQPTSTIESVTVGEQGFWSSAQKHLVTRRGNDIYTLRASPATSSEIIITIGENLFGKSE